MLVQSERSAGAFHKRKGPARVAVRKPQGRTYGFDTLKVLIGVWRLAGMPSGKYPAAAMNLRLPKLEAFGELDSKRLTPTVCVQLMRVSGTTINRPGVFQIFDAAREEHRLMNLYGYDELGTIATFGGHELRAKLVPGRELDNATVEARFEGVPRATTQISRKNLLSADLGTIRQLENRVSSLPRLAADAETRRQEGLTRIEQADEALAAPFKHADALKAAQASTHRPTRGRRSKAGRTTTAQTAPEIDPSLEKMHRLMKASFPHQPGSAIPGAGATKAQPAKLSQQPQQRSGYER